MKSISSELVLGRKYAELNFAQWPSFSGLRIFYDLENLRTRDPQLKVRPRGELLAKLCI